MTALRRYALVGKPVSHSLSPRIHAQFAAQLGLPLEYGLLEPGAEGFTDAVDTFLATGSACGVNVTLPYKAAALAYATDASHGATLAGAANTLRRNTDGTVSACNTDGAGLLLDIKRRHEITLAGARILLLGAGGAAAGIMASLLSERPVSLCVANRTVARAQELVVRFRRHANDIEQWAIGLEQLLAVSGFDVVINATASGHGTTTRAWPVQMFQGVQLAYDLSYGEVARDFLLAARAGGTAKVTDGLGMLVEQAALSFAYWEAKMPATEQVYADLTTTLVKV